jgi:hypothetical protein
MAKEKSLNNWLKHDSNAKDDFKCMLIIEQLGLEGYGIFWILVETLRDQKDYRYPIRLIGALARKYNTTEAKMTTVVKEYGLFEVDKDSFFFSHSLNRRMEAFDMVVEKRRLAGKKSGEARRKKAIEHKSNKCSTSDVRLEQNKEEEKRKKLDELKNKIQSRTTDALHNLYKSGDYTSLFSGKILSKIEKDQGFSNLKVLLENDTYDDWLLKELIE